MIAFHKYYASALLFIIIARHNVQAMDTAPKNALLPNNPLAHLRHPDFNQLPIGQQHALYIGISNLNCFLTLYFQNPSDRTIRQPHHQSIHQQIKGLQSLCGGKIDESSVIYKNLIFPFDQYRKNSNQLLQQLHKDLNDQQKEKLYASIGTIFRLYTQAHCMSKRGIAEITPTETPETLVCDVLKENQILLPKIQLLNATFFKQSGPFYTMIEQCINKMELDTSIHALLNMVWSYDSTQNYDSQFVKNCFVNIKNSLHTMNEQNRSNLVTLGMLTDTDTLVSRVWNNLTDPTDKEEIKTAYDCIAKDFFILPHNFMVNSEK